MIDMEATFPSGPVCSTDGATATLGLQQVGVLAGEKSIVLLSAVVFIAFRGFGVACFPVGRHLVEVLKSPHVVQRIRAFLAAVAVAMNSGFAFVKLSPRQILFAHGAPFSLGSRVNGGSFWHKVFSFRGEMIENLQGEIVA